MKITSHELIKDIKIIDLFDSLDARGEFTKIFNCNDYLQANLDFDIKEIYYSVSQKDVIRGMHFQLPPYEHEKLVHVLHGSVIDVIVDLRKDSETYKQCIEIELAGNKKQAVFIPKGFAHGFKSLEDGTIMQYCVSSVYCSTADSGIRFDSIGYNWNVENPIISDRDRGFVRLEEFNSLF